MSRLALGLLLLVGCESSGGGDGAVASASPSASASAAELASGPLAGLATLDGQPLPLKTAVVYSRGGAGLELELSTATPTCKDFSGNGRMLAHGERHFSVGLAKLLDEDGKEHWGLNRIYFDGHTQQGGDLGKVTIAEADAEAGVKGELDFTLTLEKSEVMKRDAHVLVVKGPFVAKGCGVFTRDGGPAARPQPEAQLTVAGKTFAVNGATVAPTTFPKPGHELVLSTGAASCKASSSDEALTLKLNLDDQGRATFAHMAGQVLPSQLNMTPGDADPSLSAKAAGPLEGEGEVSFALSGKLDLLGYAVTLGGEVTALRCPAR